MQKPATLREKNHLFIGHGDERLLYTHKERWREREKEEERECHNCWPRCVHLLPIGWKLRKCVKCCGQLNEATVPHVCLRLIADVGNSASRAQTEWVSCVCQNSGNCDGSLMWDFSGILQSVDRSPVSDYSLKRLGEGVSLNIWRKQTV